MKQLRCILFIILLAGNSGVWASDTLRVTIRQADSLFQKNNYLLLASALNIEAERAQVIQARLYPNPVFTADFNAYDPQNKKLLHTGPTGEKAFQFEQLVLLGGKRRAGIELAKTNAAIAELEFQDLIRQLRFQLHTSLYSLSQEMYLISKYNQQLSLIDTLIKIFDVQVQKRNIPLKDLVRLKGVYLDLNSKRAERMAQYFEDLSKVQTLLQTADFVSPQISEQDFIRLDKELNLDLLVQIALQSRPDYQLNEKNRILAEQYLLYQKKQNIPDLNLITSYDQRGGAFINQYNAGFSVTLPFWNRNKGNIKAATFRINAAENSLNAIRAEIEAGVRNGFANYLRSRQEFYKGKQLYNSDFDLTLKGMSSNFQKGNISLLEFVDFFESYNTAFSEFTRINIQLAVAAENINYITGKEILNNEK